MVPSTGALAWPWWGRSLPKGNQWECWEPGLGPNGVRLPAHLPPQCPLLVTHTTCQSPNAPLMPLHPCWPQCTLIPLTPCWLLSPYTPCQPSMHIWYPYTLWCPQMPLYPAGPWVPTLPASSQMHLWHPLMLLTPPIGPNAPLMPPIPLLAPEGIHFLLATQCTPTSPWHPPDTPYTPASAGI